MLHTRGGSPRAVLVSGGSRGVGRATALRFAEAGDRVAVQYATRRHDAEQTVAGLPGGGTSSSGTTSPSREPPRGSSPTPWQLSALSMSWSTTPAVAPSTENRHSVTEGSWTHWRDQWQRMLAVNLLGSVDLTRAVAEHLVERGAPGAIVNIGSRGAFRGEPEHPAYAASKAALHAFGQSMAVALAVHDIAVTSVAPGFVATERQVTTLAGSRGDDLRTESAFGRVGSPDEIAAAVFFLASRDATWAFGTVFDLNGASYLRT